MKVVTAIMSHPSQSRIAEATAKYYSRMSDVAVKNYDFMKTDEHVCRNEFYSSLDADFIVCPDTDEIITEQDFKMLLGFVEKWAYDVYQMHIIDYISPKSVISPARGHVPVIAVRSGVVFTDKRCISRPGRIATLPMDVHHLWYLGGVDWKREQYEKRGCSEVAVVDEMLNAHTESIEPPKEVLELQEVLNG